MVASRVIGLIKSTNRNFKAGRGHLITSSRKGFQMDPAALVATPTALSMKVLSKDRWEWKTSEGAKNESASTESQMSYETRLSIF